jgi:hypothetical protein
VLRHHETNDRRRLDHNVILQHQTRREFRRAFALDLGKDLNHTAPLK